jgi:hypothetical protein
MFQGLVVTQAVAQGVLGLGQRQHEPMVGSAPPPYPPAALADPELWALAGPPIERQMRVRFERLRDEGPPRPGGVIDHEHHAGIMDCGIGPGEIPPVPCNALWQGTLSRLALGGLGGGPGAFDQAWGQLASGEVERAEAIPPGVAISVAPDRPGPLEPQGRTQGGDHRKVCVIVTQQDESSRLGLW